MKHVANISTICMGLGLAVFSGVLLFTAGPLSAVAWIGTVLLFAGSTGHVANSIVNMLPERKDKPANDRGSERKPGTQTA